jgi:hypothetical protein
MSFDKRTFWSQAKRKQGKAASNRPQPALLPPRRAGAKPCGGGGLHRKAKMAEVKSDSPRGPKLTAVEAFTLLVVPLR